MLPKSVKMLTIPLFPYSRQGRIHSQAIKRIRPSDSLDIRNMLEEINKSILITFDICGKPWSVVSVYSSYSPDIHLMLLETSPDRYLPGPERVPDIEGDQLMQLWSAIMDLIAKRKANRTIHTGYNWSPRSWGHEEEKTGFQSIPTKWHPQLWGWPAFHKNRNTKFTKWVDAELLPLSEKRILGQNNYSQPFALLIKNKLKQTFHSNSLFAKLFAHHNWLIDDRGLYASFDISVPQILRIPKFFSRVLKPLAVLLDEITCDLTQILTTIKCKDIDTVLASTEKGLPKNWEKLRATPRMRSLPSIGKAFAQKDYPQSLLDAILEPVRNRCSPHAAPLNWWRKGFAYSFVLSSQSDGKGGQIRIMPAVFTGPGGVVEAMGVVLRRPEDKQFSEAQIIKKSKTLQQLTKEIKTLPFREL